VAHAVQCPYCIDAYTQTCLEKGSNVEEMTEAVHVACAIRGGSSLVPWRADAQRGRQIIDVSLGTWGSLSFPQGPAGFEPGADEPARAAKTCPPFEEKLATAGLQPLHATGITVFQINVGKFCNQTCRHCHVDAGPERTEQMTRATAELCISVLSQTDIPTVDITGGAPELNPNFRCWSSRRAPLGRHVMDRCNLTVLLLKPQAGLAEFLASNRVEVVASLPYFQSSQTDAQRGDGVFEKSVLAMQKLKPPSLRRGRQRPCVEPGVQPGRGLSAGEAGRRRGAVPSRIVAAPRRNFQPPVYDHQHADQPLSRIPHRERQLRGYMERLANAFNPAAAAGVMCRYTLSVGWEGTLYDCDFNQMLDLPLGNGAPRHIRDFDLARLNTRRIVTANHCSAVRPGPAHRAAARWHKSRDFRDCRNYRDRHKPSPLLRSYDRPRSHGSHSSYDSHIYFSSNDSSGTVSRSVHPQVACFVSADLVRALEACQKKVGNKNPAARHRGAGWYQCS